MDEILMRREMESCILRGNMDIEHFAHRGYRTSLLIATVLSAMAVTLAAVIGRGTLNLKGSLFQSVPTVLTAIAVAGQALPNGITIIDVRFLREEQGPAGEKSTYTYHVRTSEKSDYFARLRFDTKSAQWKLDRFEKLYGST